MLGGIQISEICDAIKRIRTGLEGRQYGDVIIAAKELLRSHTNEMSEQQLYRVHRYLSWAQLKIVEKVAGESYGLVNPELGQAYKHASYVVYHEGKALRVDIVFCYYIMAMVELFRKNYEEAHAIINTGMPKYDNEPILEFAGGLIRFKQGQYLESIGFFDWAAGEAEGRIASRETRAASLFYWTAASFLERRSTNEEMLSRLAESKSIYSSIGVEETPWIDHLVAILKE